MSSKLYILLHTSVTQIKKNFFNTFEVLAICYKILNRSDGFFYFLILYNITYLYKLPNKLNKFVYFLVLLWLVCLLFKLLNRSNKIIFLLTLFRPALWKISSILDRLFYFFIFDGSIIWNLLGLSSNYGHKIYIIKILAVI